MPTLPSGGARRSRKAGLFLAAPAALLCLVLPAFAQAPPADAPNIVPGKEVAIRLPKSGTTMTVYVPSDYDPHRPWPVVVNYPTWAQASTNPFRQVTKGEGFIIVALYYVTTDYSGGMLNPRMDPEKAQFVEAVGVAAEHLNVAKNMVFLGGYNRGGYFVSCMGEALIEHLAGLVILGANRSYYATHNPNPQFIKGKPIFIGVGRLDVYHVAEARKDVTLYRQFGADVTYEEWPESAGPIPVKDTRLNEWLLAYGPLRTVKKDLADARGAESRGLHGRAYLDYQAIALLSSTDETCVEAKKRAGDLADKGKAEIAAAQKRIDEKNFSQAAPALERIMRVWKGTEFEKQAQGLLDKVQSQAPPTKPATTKAPDAQADDLEKQARAAEEQLDFAKAIALYEKYLKDFSGNDNAPALREHLEKLKADKEVQKDIRDKQADRDCRAWLGLADSYLGASMPDKARPHLQKILDTYGDTRWAEEARKRLAKIGK